MHPIICQIGPFTVYMYGFVLAISVIVCTFLLQREAKKTGLNPDFVFDLVFWTVIGGIIGCRIFFIFLHLPYFIEYPSELLMVHRGGLAWQGGLIFGIAAAGVYFKKHNLPVLKMLDMIVPYAALGQAIGRIGCLLNGCCFGKEVNWGLYFIVHNARLYPTQIYSSVGLLIVFLVLRQYQETQRIPGQVFVLYLLLTSALRFFVEFYRADHAVAALGLSIFQIVTICIFITALYVYIHIQRRSKK